MRILVGTSEIAGQLLDFADGFRQLGHQVTSVIASRHPFYMANQYDVDITPSLPWPKSIAKTPFPLIRFPRGAINRISVAPRLLRLIVGHDLFVFHWAGESLTVGNHEFQLLKQLGKRIVSIPLGSDVRHVPSYLKQYQASGISPEFAQSLSCNTEDQWITLRNLRKAEKFSDLILSAPNQSNLAIRPYMHVFLPIRLERYKWCVPRREIPVLVHAPSSLDFKGTNRILGALEQLKSDGLRFELKLLHGVPNEKVIAELVQADVVVDQLYSGGYGKLGLEAMATGCALATRAYDIFWPHSPGQPIWHIELSNLYPQLKRLLTDRDLRLRLANEGRNFVERHHDHRKVAQRILDLVSKDIEEYDYYPTYFAREFHLEPGEVIPPKVKRITAEVVRRWGLPEDVDPMDMIRRGLMSADGSIASQPIPRWPVSSRAANTTAV